MSNHPFEFLTIIVTLIIVFGASIVLSEEIISEEWMNIYFLNVKIGYSYSKTVKSEYREKPCICTTTNEIITGLREGTEITSETKTVEYEDENFCPLFVELEIKMSKALTKIEGDFAGEKYKITIETPESSIDSEVEKVDGLLLSKGIEHLIHSKGFESNTSYSYKCFYYNKPYIMNVKVESLGKEEVEYNDKKIMLNKLKTTMEEMNITMMMYVDDKGVDYISEITSIGMKTVRCSKEEAIQEISPSDLFEIDNFMFKPEGKIGKLSKIYKSKKCEIFISTNNLDLHRVLLSDNRQIVEFKDKNHASVVLYNTLKEKPKKGFERPFIWVKENKSEDENSVNIDRNNESPFKKYLDNSPYIQSNNQKIKMKAAEIVGEEKDILSCSKLICKWVFKNIKTKNYKTIYASAAEVLENLEGDCSEHSILFIALARSLGIPTRGVIGLLYSKEMGAYAYHAWCEVYAGEWIAVDPTLGLDYVTAAHLALNKTEMSEISSDNQESSLIEMIKDFKVEIN